MRRQRLVRFTAVLLTLLPVLVSCTTEELGHGLTIEAAYVELAYALHRGEATAAATAMQQLDREINALPTGKLRAYFATRDDDNDNSVYFFEQSRLALRDARVSILEDNLGQSSVQVDRSVYYLLAAEPILAERYYIAGIYDFLAAWNEIEVIAREFDFCGMEWRDYESYAEDVSRAWRQISWRRPDAQLYGFTPERLRKFENAHAAVEHQLNIFRNAVRQDDQCEAERIALEVDGAVQRLIQVFSRTDRISPQLGHSVKP
ncbi:iron-containing alcohol dehydrogenase family protein [Neolewinella antarctica]|uniref:Uncharacterized protein n=1 Tax=Neolewinella antarctica TaxID=442734 RepID=A0ABX0X8J9_9BACT|nr:iron-containing alcohol dehydrogenase family protein [Neolewinella antarctica]NJC25584.1 hypothetical protein [Neolewinella antarctica]